MDPLITNGEIKITDLSRAPILRSSDLFVAATHLDGFAEITTQAISSCVLLDYVLSHGPYNFGANLSSIGVHTNPTLDGCFVCDINAKHYSIIPSNPAWPQSQSQPEAPNCTTDSYYSNIGGGTGNVVWGTESTIGGGCYNTVMDSNSVIAGGKNNIINCCESSIGGGGNNISCGIYSTIGGGNCNVANQEASTIAGGKLNLITTPELTNITYRGGVISGGTNNALSGCYGFIGGGYHNDSTGNHSVIVAGECNNVDSHHSFIGGGEFNNIASGNCSVIIGGGSNIISGGASILIGGTHNNINGIYSVVNGGYNNSITGGCSYIGTGDHNHISGNNSSVVAGVCNFIASDHSFIGTGLCNSAIQTHASVLNGRCNNSLGEFSAILNGQNNVALGSNSTVLNGCVNTASGNCSLIGGGCYNIASNAYSTILGGHHNSASAVHSFIAGGSYNNSNSYNNTFILGSAISATRVNFTYVNNLSSGDEIYAANNVCSINQCATNCIGSGNNICATNTICGNYICGRSCVSTPRSFSSICASTPLISSQYAYISEKLYGNIIYANKCVHTTDIESSTITNIGTLTNVGQLTSVGSICNYGAFNNTGTMCNIGYFHNEGTICNTTGSICSNSDIVVGTTGRFLSGGQDLLELFNSYTAGSGFYKTPYVVQFIGDGVTTKFSDLNFPSINPNNFLISIAGLIQRPYIDFTSNLSNKGSVVFSSPPPAGQLINIYANQSSEVGKSIVGFYNPQYTTFTADGTSFDYSIPSEVYNGTDPNGYLVSVTGLVQRPTTDFTVLSANDGLNGIIHFVAPPPLNGAVTIHSFKFSTISIFNSIFNYLSASNFNIPISSFTAPGITAAHIVATSDIYTPFINATRIAGSTVSGNLTITGNLSTLGTTTFVGSIISNTSALSVVNYGPSPALWVGQYSTVGDIASFYDLDQQREVLHVGGINGINPNVGILTSAPNKTLTVAGEISATGSLFSSGNLNVTGSGINYINGNVGLGTLTPRSKLDLNSGVIAGVANIRGFSNSGAYSIWGGLGSDGAIDGGAMAMYGSTHPTNPNVISFGNSTLSPTLYITQNGNIGINTGTPSEKLSVSGNITATGTLNIGGTSVLNGPVFLGRQDTSLEGGQLIFAKALNNTDAWNIDVYGNDASPRLRFFTSGEKMTILNDGKVGIGTSAPTKTLQVNGDFQATNIYGSLNVNQIAGTLLTSQGGTGGATASAGAKNLLDGIGTGTSGYVLKTGGAGNYYWAAETGASIQVGTLINSTRAAWTATASQTVFTAPSYTTGANQLRVYVNGVRQTTNDYAETSTTSFTLTVGCNVGDYVLAEVDGYYTYPNIASAVVFSPIGNVTAINVQNAIAELDTEKFDKTGGTISGDVTMSAAKITLAAGTTTKPPLVFSSGANLSSPLAGAVEWDGSKLYVTQTVGPTRRTVATEDYVTTALASYAPKAAPAFTGACQIGVSGSNGSLLVYGDINATGDVIAAYAPSDIRLKSNIVPISDALNKIDKISGVEFIWNNKQQLYKGKDVGVIAQEIEKVLPEVVAVRHDGYNGVKYEKIVALLIEGIKELRKEVEELKRK